MHVTIGKHHLAVPVHEALLELTDVLGTVREGHCAVAVEEAIPEVTLIDSAKFAGPGPMAVKGRTANLASIDSFAWEFYCCCAGEDGPEAEEEGERYEQQH